MNSEEHAAIRALRNLEKNWPDTLWLFAANGGLCVMRKDDGRRRVLTNGSMDPSAVVTNIAIESDGGDW